MFMMYYKPLVEAGRLYAAVPPLYSIHTGGKDKDGNPNTKYFIDKLDMTRYCQKIFSKNNQLSDTKNKVLHATNVTDLLFKNIDYVFEMDMVASRYALHPLVLEKILLHQFDKFETLKKNIEKEFPLIKVNKVKNTIICEGLFADKIQTAYLTKELFDDCIELTKLIHQTNNKEIYYKLNGKLVSMYTIIALYEKTMPKDIVRLKGLGEMDDYMIRDAFTDTNKRVLIQYTVEDIKEDYEAIKYMYSNSKELIKDVEVTRRDMLG